MFLIEPKTERSLIIEVKEKPYCFSVFVVWLHEHGGYRGFPKTVTLEALTKKVVHFDWQKADINRRLLIYFF